MAGVLVLGAGMVTRPLVRYLLKHGVGVTVASRTVEKAEALVAGFEKGRAVAWTAENREELQRLVRTHDVVISMLPYAYHLQVAQVCLEEKRHLITTSYVKPEMKALDAEARSRGLLFLNEMGLDPGIDHMSAMRAIRRLESEGFGVRVLESFGGALPAPEALDNPWNYKFSWSPRGVLLAATRPARFMRDGRITEISGEALFARPFLHEVEGLGTFEVYPNGDAVRYRELYGIPEVSTIFRGTLRWPGWAETMRALLRLGYLSEKVMSFQGLTYAGLLRRLTGRGGAPEEILSAVLGLPPDAPVIRRLLSDGSHGEGGTDDDARRREHVVRVKQDAALVPGCGEARSASVGSRRPRRRVVWISFRLRNFGGISRRNPPSRACSPGSTFLLSPGWGHQDRSWGFSRSPRVIPQRDHDVEVRMYRDLLSQSLASRQSCGRSGSGRLGRHR